MQPDHSQQPGVMGSYSIQVPNEKAATYNLVSFIIVIINVFAFASAIVYENTGPSKILLIIGLITALHTLFLEVYRRYAKKPTGNRVEILMIICSLTWVFTSNYLPGVLLFLFSLSGLISPRKKIIHFSSDGIRYPSFPVKQLSWKEVDFVILKDDVLTIEMKNNRLMQFTLEKHVAAGLDPDEFNNFCREQLV